MNFIIFLLLFIQGILILFILGVSIIATYFMINSGFMRNAPPVPTCGQVKSAMIQDVAKVLTKRKSQVIMDLGSGWGSLLLPLAQKFPKHKFIGIEYGLIPYFVSKLRAKKLRNITFYRQNFFNTDISKADIIFLFLLPHVMPKIAAKCQKETKRGALIYVNRFPFPKVKEKKKISFGSKFETYYVYETKR